MMDVDPIRPNTLSELSAVEHNDCVSLFMPTHVKGSQSRQDPIRLGNLLDQVQDQLKSRGRRRPDVEALLKPARDVIDQASFWQFQGVSLAVFLADGYARIIRLPEPVEESITVGPHFNIKPLLGSLVSSEPFYVLALTKEHARMYRATRTDFEEIQAEGWPLTADEVVGVREPEPELQHHSGMPPRGGRGDRGHRGDAGQANYHGHGEGEVKLEADQIHFVKEVAERVADYLYGDDAPLVLAADTSLVGEYRREHLRGRLIETDHVESPDALKPHEIRERAWEIASPALKTDLSTLLDRFGTAAAAGKAAEGFSEVAVAAAQGKVDVLLFDPRAAQRGWLSDDCTSAHVGDPPDAEEGKAPAEEKASSEDLVNRAIIDTLRSSGRAVPLAAAQGREDRDAQPQPPKAILRY